MKRTDELDELSDLIYGFALAFGVLVWLVLLIR